MPKTLIAYPLVVATGAAIGSGQWTLSTFFAGPFIGLAAALLFESTMWLLKKNRGSGRR